MIILYRESGIMKMWLNFWMLVRVRFYKGTKLETYIQGYLEKRTNAGSHPDFFDHG
jgi:hypothetical protein